MDLNNKLAFVTGGSKGLGKVICEQLAACGCDLIIHYNKSQEQALELQKSLEHIGRKVWLIQSDFLNADSIKSLFPEQIVPLLEKIDRKIDLIVNNAGLYGFQTRRQLQDTVFYKFFDINVKAPMQIMKDAYHFMQEGGKIVNISSTTSTHPNEQMIIYGASKAALENLSKAFSKLYLEKKVSVNIVAPGLLETDTMPKVIQNYVKRKYPDMQPGNPKDVANVIVFIASNLSAWVNAQRIEVTGGVHYG